MFRFSKILFFYRIISRKLWFECMNKMYEFTIPFPLFPQSMFEVLTSEASYLRSLRVLTEHFLDSRDLDEALIIRDRKTLFSNVLRVREVSER